MPSSKGSRTIPSMASLGIHDTEVTEDSILTPAVPPLRLIGPGKRSHDARSAGNSWPRALLAAGVGAGAGPGEDPAELAAGDDPDQLGAAAQERARLGAPAGALGIGEEQDRLPAASSSSPTVRPSAWQPGATRRRVTASTCSPAATVASTCSPAMAAVKAGAATTERARRTCRTSSVSGRRMSPTSTGTPRRRTAGR
jgi:hypothetical protein